MVVTPVNGAAKRKRHAPRFAICNNAELSLLYDVMRVFGLFPRYNFYGYERSHHI